MIERAMWLWGQSALFEPVHRARISCAEAGREFLVCGAGFDRAHRCVLCPSALAWSGLSLRLCARRGGEARTDP